MAKTINVDLKGKTAVVTGSTGGIGKEVARGLLTMGAHVILGVRNVEKGKEVAKELGGSSSVLQVDTSSPASIRAFAAQVKQQAPKLHLLVNNAGVWFSDLRKSPEGRELTFATNVLGPYVLTEELLPLLKASAPARIVNVVSGLASDYDANDLEFEKRGFNGFKVYGASKAAARMITFGLARRLAGTTVTVNAAAPGFVKTEFNRSARGPIATMINISAKLFALTPAQGAYGILYAAASPDVQHQSGKYYDRGVEKPSKYRDEAAIVELEKKLSEMASGVAKAA